MKKKDKISIIIGALILITVVGLLIFNSIKKPEELEVVTDKIEEASDNNEINDSGIETDVVFEEVTSEVKKENEPYFKDPRNFTEEELAEEEEPEGADTYEVDEEESPYTVTVDNLKEMADKYNDMYNCYNLKYYIMVYLRNITGDMDTRYVATLIEDSCINDDNSLVLTVDATLDKYPDVILHIEYDKVNKEFGINSSLGDYSLDALKQESKIKSLKYNPEYDTEDNDIESSIVSDEE